ncbi:hypothetical protein U9M48_021082 [Paspalum notatum var. saurae]|uniref:Uncharacterized protein n=1 Tax=Paspalum notatum var. saurae TaxID=547442 RepID=A0AAQ3TG22_PASNO
MSALAAGRRLQATMTLKNPKHGAMKTLTGCYAQRRQGTSKNSDMSDRITKLQIGLTMEVAFMFASASMFAVTLMS